MNSVFGRSTAYKRPRHAIQQSVLGGVAQGRGEQNSRTTIKTFGVTPFLMSRQLAAVVY